MLFPRPELGIASLSLGSCDFHTMKDKLMAAARAGFQSIEVFDLDWFEWRDSYAKAKGLPASTEDGDATSMKAATALYELCSSLGIRISCFQPIRDFEGLLDPSEKAAAFKKAAGYLKIMKNLKTDLIVGCTTTIGAPRTTNSIDRIVEDWSWLVGEAAKCSPPIKVAYEGLSFGAHYQTWQHAHRIVKLVNKPNFGVCLDSFNFLAREWANPNCPSGVRSPDVDAKVRRNLAELVATLPKEKIFFYQAADGRRMTPPMPLPEDPSIPPLMPWSRNHRLFPLEQDENAYLPVVDFTVALVKTGYAGPWSLEVFNASLREPEADVPIKHALRGMAGLEALLAATDAALQTGKPLLEAVL